MKRIFLVILSLSILTIVTGQNKTANSVSYKSAAGIRLWNGGSLSLKTFVKDKAALEFTGGFYSGGAARVTAAYLYHGDLSTDGELKWYFGAGGSMTFVDKKTIPGIFGAVGLDYKFKELPLNLSADWQPGFQFYTGYGYTGGWFGLAARYTF